MEWRTSGDYNSSQCECCHLERSACPSWQPMRLPYKIRVQKMLNRRINSWRASIACAGFIRLSTFSRRSRSIAASSRTSRLPAFHFAYLPAPMPSASSKDTIQTVMSVEVTRSIAIKSERQWNVFFSGESSTQRRFSCPREGGMKRPSI